MTGIRLVALLRAALLVGAGLWVACDSGGSVPSVAAPGAAGAEAPGGAASGTGTDGGRPAAMAAAQRPRLVPGQPAEQDPEILAIWASDDPLPMKIRRVAALKAERARVRLEAAGVPPETIEEHREKFMELVTAHIEEVKRVVQ